MDMPCSLLVWLLRGMLVADRRVGSIDVASVQESINRARAPATDNRGSE